MAEQARFADGHVHTEACAQLYAEWRRYHAIVLDTSRLLYEKRAIATVAAAATRSKAQL